MSPALTLFSLASLLDSLPFVLLLSNLLLYEGYSSRLFFLFLSIKLLNLKSSQFIYFFMIMRTNIKHASHVWRQYHYLTS